MAANDDDDGREEGAAKKSENRFNEEVRQSVVASLVVVCWGKRITTRHGYGTGAKGGRR
jgi:hypothetical protein